MKDLRQKSINRFSMTYKMLDYFHNILSVNQLDKFKGLL